MPGGGGCQIKRGAGVGPSPPHKPGGVCAARVRRPRIGGAEADTFSTHPVSAAYITGARHLQR